MALTAVQVKGALPEDKPVKLADAGGLVLLIQPNGSKWWRLRYRFAGREKMMSLGVYPDVSLAEARVARDEAKAMLRRGVDPSSARQADKRAQVEAVDNRLTKVAERWLKVWSSGKAARSIENAECRLKWLTGELGRMPVAEIRSRDVSSAMERICRDRGAGVARSVLVVANQVFRYAKAAGLVENNPAADLSAVLPAVVEGHRAAVTDVGELGDTLRRVWTFDGYAPLAAFLKVLPYLFCRPGELREMKWADVDLEAGEWRYRTGKTGTDMVTPLAPQVVELIESMKPLSGRTRWVFASMRNDGPIDRATASKGMLAAGLGGIQSAHGWRATARTILDEQLGFRPDWIEAQLGHVVRDTNGRAYNRTTHLDGRRTMMQAWADFLDQTREGSAGDDNVVPLRRAG